MTLPVVARSFRTAFTLFILCVPFLDLTAANKKAAAEERAEFQVLPLIRSKQNHLLVRAFVNGREAWLTVDSGSPISAISTSRRSYFHLTGITPKSDLPARIQVNDGFGKLAIAHEFQLGVLTLREEPVVLLNLKGLSKASQLVNDAQVDGILGADVLLLLEAVLDCQARTLTLKLNPGHPGRMPGTDYRNFNSAKMHVSEGYNLFVNGAVNGMPGKLMVDTGAPFTILHHAFVQQIHVATRRTEVVSEAINMKVQGMQVARIQRLSFGAINIGSGVVGVRDLGGLIQTPLPRGSPPFAGLLGSEILDRAHGIIDFGTRTLYMRK